MDSNETDSLLHFADLIAAYLEGKLSLQQRAELEAKLMTDASFKQMFDSFNNKTQVLTDLKAMNGFDTEVSLVEFHKKHVAPKTFKLWPRIAVAAVVAIAFGIWLYNNEQRIPKQVQDSTVYNNDIAPGKQGATLTLANGRKIKLTDAANGEITREAGISVTKTIDGQLVYELKGTTNDPNKINTLSTAKGETYILTLPDKSKVWLNAASSLTYTVSLRGAGHDNKRIVNLEGEAYFEIAKDKKHPFVVVTRKQEVEVLGTHFNINSYANETATSTTLLEGSVKVTAGNFKQVLEPGQQSVVTVNQGISVKEVDVNASIDWKNGEFVFEGEDIKSIMNRVAKWYDIEVVYNGVMPIEGFNGIISRNKNISAVLKMLEETNAVHFRIEGRQVYVSK